MSSRLIGMVSPYPLEGDETTSFSALAGYTKTLLSCMDGNYRDKIVVLAQRTSRGKNFIEKLEGLDVFYVWRYNNPLFFLDILIAVIKNKIKVIHFQHEVFVFGKKQYVYPYLNIILLLILRIIGVSVVTTVHGVVSLKSINKKFSESNKVRAPLFLIKFGLRIMYKLTCNLSSEVIVHNQKLSSLLQKDYRVRGSKIHVIPHPLYKYETTGVRPLFLEENLLQEAKNIVLFFGFLAPYKGLDTLIQAATSKKIVDSNIYFLIVGSVPKRYLGDALYNSWLNGVKEKSGINKKILWSSNYVPDNEIGGYFEIADLIVIPYSQAMSASGPLSIAIYYEKPVLVSDSFNGVVQNGLIYGKTAEDLATALVRYFDDELYGSEIKRVVVEQKIMWSDKLIGTSMARLYRKFLAV